MFGVKHREDKRGAARTATYAATILAALAGGALLGSLAGCESAPPAPVSVITPRPDGTPPPGGPAGATGTASEGARHPAPFGRSKARWRPADWGDLPGWQQDDVAQAWGALLASCTRPAPELAAAWAGPCAQARGSGWSPAAAADAARIRTWLQTTLQPWRLEADDGRADGLLTGYYEPLIDARRRPAAGWAVPLHAPPADLATRQPWYSRAEAETLAEAQAALRGREIAYVADPLDALVLQIQGSGRLRLLDEPDASGQPRVVRLGFAAHNGQPYQSIGRWLIEQGALTPEQASWPAIRAWARLHPERQDEMLRANPRLVFFREQPLADPEVGPLGAQGVPLTPGRSIAVDRDSVPLGTPVWIVSTEPQAWAPADSAPLPRPLQRLVIAQDTGGAIVGAVRADFFWGWGEGPQLQAGRTRQPLRMWALWPLGLGGGTPGTLLRTPTRSAPLP